ncbi:MAG: T9SS type A sorting domain-containing protein [Bacteroidota bacterium]
MTVSIAKPFQSGVLKLFDLRGQMVERIKLDGNNLAYQIQVDRLTPGVYLIQVLVDGQAFTEELVVE